MIPSQWIETDKNAHLQKMGKYIKADFKSRLVGCGQNEDTTELRTDSPTCELEALNLIISFAACHCYRLKCGDIRNAYFQGKELDIILLLKPPRGGLPDPDITEDACMHVVGRPPPTQPKVSSHHLRRRVPGAIDA